MSYVSILGFHLFILELICVRSVIVTQHSYELSEYGSTYIVSCTLAIDILSVSGLKAKMPDIFHFKTFKIN
jgi:hypothetical protein